MKYPFILATLMFSNIAQAQVYPLVENGQVIHMKDSKFYNENNYGGYTIKGCNIIFNEVNTKKKMFVPLDMMTHYENLDNKVVIVNGAKAISFEPNNHTQFVNGLMNHKFYCINSHLLQTR